MNENKDVLRAEFTEAGITGAIRGKQTMYATDTYRMVHKFGDGSFKYWSPDTVATGHTAADISYTTDTDPSITTVDGALDDIYTMTGIFGNTGSQGFTGARGFTGAQGLQGIQGNTGLQGGVGPAGSTGAQGIQGTTGTQGTAGAAGAAGAQGTTGVNGATGAAYIGTVGLNELAYGITGAISSSSSVKTNTAMGISIAGDVAIGITGTPDGCLQIHKSISSDFSKGILYQVGESAGSTGLYEKNKNGNSSTYAKTRMIADYGTLSDTGFMHALVYPDPDYDHCGFGFITVREQGHVTNNVSAFFSWFTQSSGTPVLTIIYSSIGVSSTKDAASFNLYCLPKDASQSMTLTFQNNTGGGREIGYWLFLHG